MTNIGSSQSLRGRVALVTGASRGLGAAIAERYAAEGAHVIALARTVGGLEALDDRVRAQNADAKITLVPVDLTDTARLDSLGPSLLPRFERIDIWVANAAMLGGLTPLAHYDEKTWRQVFDVNVHANWHLLRSLEPLLKRSAAGRAIFVTADVAATPKAYWGAYAAAKSALTTMARTWAAENERTSLTVHIVDPGPMATRLRAEAFPGEDQSQMPDPVTATDQFVTLAQA